LDRATARSTQSQQTTAESTDTLKAFSQSASLGSQSISRIRELQDHIKRLSTTAISGKPLVPIDTIVWTLQDSQLSSSCPTCRAFRASGEDSAHVSLVDAEPYYEHELELMLLSKATMQAYGQVLNTILNETIALQDHVWYWEDVISSRRQLGIYSLQTSPIRIWSWSFALTKDLLSRREALSDGWSKFYALVRDAIRERSILGIKTQAISPLARVRNEIVQKQKELRLLRDINSNALGVLLGEGLAQIEEAAQNLFSNADASSLLAADQVDNVPKSIALLEAVLSRAGDPSIDMENFELQISSSTAQDEWSTPEDSSDSINNIMPNDVSVRLQKILNVGLANYSKSFRQRLSECGRPSRLVRYWLPASATILASSTVLKLLLNRKESVISWIREIGETVLDFWTNWVVEPTRKVIGTIRHDEGSEIALISKGSLQEDWESLEKMVVEFAIDNPESGSLSEGQIQEIRDNIREGRLTPVLKAYEKDVQKPLFGVMRGRLIRELLIQIQKTKVDGAVALGGIDSLLKSQELVFRFVTVVPG
jgi:nuclear control of ATPase protein 2